MYEKFMIRGEQFRNTCEGGKITGFQLGVTITAYHGKVLQDLKCFDVRVDGVDYPEEDIRFCLRGRSFTMEQMRREAVFRWEFAEVALLRVKKPGGLSAGIHEVYVNQVHNAGGADGANAFTTRLVLRSPIRRGVSLYSYQQEYYKGELDLEAQIKAVHDLGADGIEILAEETVTRYPNPADHFVDRFQELMDKYHMSAVCYDACHGQPAVEKLRGDILLAKKLGFGAIRVQARGNTLEACLPFAEEHGIRLGVEIHSPSKITDRKVTDVIELADRTGSRFVGLIPDCGVFMQAPVRVVYERHLRRGATPELIRHSIDAFMSGSVTREENIEAVRALGGNEIDLYYAGEVFDYVINPPEALTELVPYIINIHGKVYEMTDEGPEFCIPYDRICAALQKGNYDGYICTEFEGQRHFHDLRQFDIDSVEQVRRHHTYMKQFIG